VKPGSEAEWPSGWAAVSCLCLLDGKFGCFPKSVMVCDVEQSSFVDGMCAVMW
jgi:hypothetical protein